VAAQLAASQEGLSSMELVMLDIIIPGLSLGDATMSYCA
jgi:hypothetical protein